MESVKDKVMSFIKESFLQVSGLSSFNEDDSFLQRGIIDSTGVLELVSFIEVTFKIKVEDEELIPDNLDSLNKVTAFIKRKIDVSQ